jgi:chromate transporter
MTALHKEPTEQAASAEGATDRATGSSPLLVPYALRHLVLYALRLGAVGFGGPVALVGYMRRDLVERRRWITEAEYAEGLALAQLAPGPLAAQLAMYLGYVHHRVRGAALVGFAFVVPSFLMVVLLGWAYVHFGGLPWIHVVFYGVGASVIGIIAASALKLTRRTLGRARLLWVLYLVVVLVTVLTASEPVLLVILAGVIAWLASSLPMLPPHWWHWGHIKGRTLAWLSSHRSVQSDTAGSSHRLVGGARFPGAAMVLPVLSAGVAAAGTLGTLMALFVFFLEAGALVFGSGLAIVPFLYGGVVHDHHWLTNQQFVDAVSVALLTPGPVVITSGFIGFLVAGLAGAGVATLGTFLPAYVFTIVLAPVLRRYGQRSGVAAFVRGITAGAVGAITGAVFILGRQSIVDLPTAMLALATFGLLVTTNKVPEPVIVLAAALLGVLLYPGFHH